MPVLSPHRSSSSALGGSYNRSGLNSSTLDRPYYGSSNYSPRISNYSERYSTRIYTDSDGRRIYSRSGSVTEDGVTTRFREESRESSVTRRDSASRDNALGYRDSDSYGRRDGSYRERSADVGSRVSALSLHDSVAELRNKYSPANYVPACIRQKNENISRSKSINDIGLPPSSTNRRNSKVKRNGDCLMAQYNNSLNNLSSNNTNNDINNIVKTEDDDNDKNGNSVRTRVADLRRKFAPTTTITATTTTTTQNPNDTRQTARSKLLEIDSKICENRFKKQDEKRNTGKKIKPANNNGATSNDDNATLSKSDVKTQPSAGDSPILQNGTNSYHHQQDGLNGDKSCDRNGDEEEATTGREVNLKKKKKNAKINNNSAGHQETNGDIDAEEKRNLLKNDKGYVAGEVFANGDTTAIQEPNSEKREQHGASAAPPAAAQSKLTNSTASTSSSSTSNSRYSTSSSRRSVDRNNLYDDNFLNNNNNGTNHVNNINNNNGGGKVLGLNGLKNIGNTCFMNSVIQCLSNTKQLLEYVIKDAYVPDINTSISGMKGALIKSFAEVIKELWSEDAIDRVVNTTSLKSQIQRFAPRFIGYAQQDAQEFLRYLLEGLHEDVNKVKEKPKPILTEIDEKLSDAEKASESWSRYLRMDNSRIVDCFVGQLKSTLKCTHCGHCSVTFDPFWDLSLPIPQRTGQVRLSQCLDSFTREETLDGDEKPTCSKCKERRKCTKSFTIQKFPKVLVLHLKRFSLAERFRGKLSGTVDFPLEGLDMSQYAADQVAPCRYNLYAISNHSGTTYSGHYTAYCRHPYAKTWHEYNDSRVSSISPKSIVSSEAYVLFYEQDGKKSHL